MGLTRSCIYPKDVQRITGKSERYSRKLLMIIKAELKKEKHQFVSIDEFAKYVGLNSDLVKTYITD